VIERQPYAYGTGQLFTSQLLSEYDLRMVQLSKDSVAEFQQLWKKEFGQELTDEQAEEYGSNLVRFVDLMSKMTQDNVDTRPE
jgi:hypothetical protein